MSTYYVGPYRRPRPPPTSTEHTMLTETGLARLRAISGSERDPQGTSFAMLAEALRRAGRLGEAREVVLDGVERHPAFPSGLVVAARVALASGDAQEARSFFERVIALDPDNHVALLGAAEVALALGDVTEARLCHERMAAGGLGDPEAVRALGARVQQSAVQESAAAPTSTDDLSAAIQEVTTTSGAAGEKGGEALLTRTLAELLVAQGLLSEAVGAFQQLVDRAPADESLRRRLQEVTQLATAGPTERSAQVVEVDALAPTPQPVDALAPAAEPVGALGPDLHPVDEMAPETHPVEDLAPDEVVESGPPPRSVQDLRPDATPVQEIAPEASPIEDLAPPRKDERLNEEFRRWLQGRDG